MSAVSVVIPLYNKGPYIARTLKSILSQTVQDFEVIVVDDGSTDNGAEVVSGFDDPRIRLIRQNNQGASAARNRGVAESMTEFIAFLDADDVWMPTHLETIMRLRENYPQAGMFATSFNMRMPDGKIRLATYKFIPDAPWEGLIPNYFKSAALGITPVCSSVAGIPKVIFNEAGGFTQGYWFGEDEDFWARIALKYPVAFSWELGATYHWDAINRATVNGGPLNYEEPFIKTMREALSSGQVLPEFVEPINEIIYRKECYRASKNILAGESKTALAILRHCKTKWFYAMKFKLMVLAIMPHQLLFFIRKIKRKLLL